MRFWLFGMWLLQQEKELCVKKRPLRHEAAEETVGKNIHQDVGDQTILVTPINQSV